MWILRKNMQSISLKWLKTTIKEKNVMKALLIDVGSTFIKYSVYEKGKGVLYFDKTPFPEPLINDNVRFVVSRETLCDKILNIFEKTQDYGCSVALFSVQMHGYVAKGKDGSFSEYVSWRDKSGDAKHAKFDKVNFNEFGLTLTNNLPVTKIDGDSVEEFYTLGSYLSFILTGNNATHITDAFASGFYYSPSGKPNDFAKGMVMPSVCQDVEVVGEYKGVKIICPFGDHQISFLGSGAKTDSYLINIGTGAQVCCIAPYGYPDAAYQKRPYFDTESCLYSFCGLRGIDGKSCDINDFINRLIESIKLLPKKNSVIVGGGGGEETFSFIKRALEELGLSCVKADFNVGTQGLIILAENLAF